MFADFYHFQNLILILYFPIKIKREIQFRTYLFSEMYFIGAIKIFFGLEIIYLKIKLSQKLFHYLQNIILLF